MLDTNICVFLLRGEITEAELKYGAELGRKQGLTKRIQKLDELLASLQVLPIRKAIDLYASEKARLRFAGTPADDDFDLLIGCTSIVYGMVMVTENLKDFKNLAGIRIENWVTRTHN